MSLIKELSKEIGEAGIVVKDSEIQERLDTLQKFKVPGNEIKRSILTHFGVSSKGGGGDNSIGPVSDLSDGDWTSLKVKVVQLWENNHDSIDQAGVVGDESGSVKFTKWATAQLPQLEEGKSYVLLNVVASVYNEKLQISLNKKSKVEPLSEDIEVKDNTTTFIGAVVSVQSNSGLITRCDVCSKAIKGTCDKHPEASGHYDVRIVGSIDNGQRCVSIMLDAEMVESVTEISVELAKTIATEAMDKEAVIKELEKAVIGKFFYISGSDMDGTILVRSMVPYVKSIPDADIKGLIDYIRK